MRHDTILGVALGSLVCAVAITGNLMRADPHLVSFYPDIASALIVPLVIFISLRRQRRSGAGAEAVQAFGVRVGAVAGATFGAGLGAFTVYMFGAWSFVAFGTATAFLSVFVLSCLAAYVAGHRRILAA